MKIYVVENNFIAHFDREMFYPCAADMLLSKSAAHFELPSADSRTAVFFFIALRYASLSMSPVTAGSSWPTERPVSFASTLAAPSGYCGSANRQTLFP